MKITRTIPISLPGDEDVRRTVWNFRTVLQGVSEVAFDFLLRPAGEDRRPPSAIALHRLCYGAFKGKTSSQMTGTAIRLVAGAYQSAWSKGHPIRRPFDFRWPPGVWLIGERGRDASLPSDGTLSLWTVSGRKHLPFSVPARFQNMFERVICVNSLSVSAGPADAAAIRRAGDEGGAAEDAHDLTGGGGEGPGQARRLRAWLTVTLEAPDPTGRSPVGVDRGALNALVAVDSEDRVLFLSGREHQARNERTRQVRLRVRRKMAARRARKKDTRSVRRLLKRLSRRQQNRTRTFAQQAALALCRVGAGRGRLRAGRLAPSCRPACPAGPSAGAPSGMVPWLVGPKHKEQGPGARHRRGFGFRGLHEPRLFSVRGARPASGTQLPVLPLRPHRTRRRQRGA